MLILSSKYSIGNRSPESVFDMTGQLLLAGLIPLHILHHAVEEDIFGKAILDELQRHGYRIGPGTLYPMLHRLEERGYLRAREVREGSRMRRLYRATAAGRKALQDALPQVTELFTELVGESHGRRKGHPKRTRTP